MLGAPAIKLGAPSNTLGLLRNRLNFEPLLSPILLGPRQPLEITISR